jgi:hypothetical protein
VRPNEVLEQVSNCLDSNLKTLLSVSGDSLRACPEDRKDDHCSDSDQEKHHYVSRYRRFRYYVLLGTHASPARLSGRYGRWAA